MCKITLTAHTIFEVITLGNKPEQRKERLKKSNADTFAAHPNQGIAPKKKKD